MKQENPDFKAYNVLYTQNLLLKGIRKRKY